MLKGLSLTLLSIAALEFPGLSAADESVQCAECGPSLTLQDQALARTCVREICARDTRRKPFRFPEPGAPSLENQRGFATALQTLIEKSEARHRESLQILLDRAQDPRTSKLALTPDQEVALNLTTVISAILPSLLHESRAIESVSREAKNSGHPIWALPISEEKLRALGDQFRKNPDLLAAFAPLGDFSPEIHRYWKKQGESPAETSTAAFARTAAEFRRNLPSLKQDWILRMTFRTASFKFLDRVDLRHPSDQDLERLRALVIFTNVAKLIRANPKMYAQYLNLHLFTNQRGEVDLRRIDGSARAQLPEKISAFDRCGYEWVRARRRSIPESWIPKVTKRIRAVKERMLTHAKGTLSGESLQKFAKKLASLEIVIPRSPAQIDRKMISDLGLAIGDVSDPVGADPVESLANLAYRVGPRSFEDRIVGACPQPYESEIFSDRYEYRHTKIEISFDSIEGDVLESVAAHEMAHVLGIDFEMGVLSSHTRKTLETVNDCLMQQHGPGLMNFLSGPRYNREDFADLISAQSEPDQTAHCELIRSAGIDSEEWRLSRDEGRAATQDHSTDFFRILHSEIARGRPLPAACLQISTLKAGLPFKRCLPVPVKSR